MLKILHLDIETAPNLVYTWGLFNQTVSLAQIVKPSYTMCWAAKWHDKSAVMFSSLHTGSNKQMMKNLWKLLDEADAVVHYNGERFDMPIINKEFLLLGIKPPSPYHNIDLLKVARSRFKFTSNKLDFIVNQLKLGSKITHSGWELWIKCMAGDDKSWNKMRRYNIQDVKLLPLLYSKLLPWIKKHPNQALFMEADRPVCPNCGSEHVVKRGIETTLTMAYQRYSCKDCGLPIRGRTNTLTKQQKQNILTSSKL